MELGLKERCYTACMKNRATWAAALFLFAGPAFSKIPQTYHPTLKDAYEWLVPLKEKKATRWVDRQNKIVEKKFLRDPRFDRFKKEAFQILSSEGGLSEGTLRGGYFYTVDRSGSRKLGMWQRISFDALIAGDDSKWEPLLDLDKLSAKEKASWGFKYATCLGPLYERCLVFLSQAGADIAELREFDLKKKVFIPGGFHFPVADSQVQWLDANRILFASDFGPGTTTTGNWARQVKLWKRGQPVEQARVVYDAKAPGTTGAFLEPFEETPTDVLLLGEWVSFREVVYFLFQKGSFSRKIDLPRDCTIREVRAGTAYLTLLSDWDVGGRKFTQGSLLALNLREVLRNGKALPQALFVPSENEVVVAVNSTKGAIWVSTLKNVESRLLRFTQIGGKWKQDEVLFPEGGTVDLIALERDSDRLIARHESFLVPESFYAFRQAELHPKKFIQVRSEFDAKGLTVERRSARSADGTRVPYFLIRSKKSEDNGRTPTLLWGYGAANISYSPFYLGAIGKTWVSRGGAYVHSVLRGGGELGPDWRKGGYKQNKPNTFADFTAVAEDLEKTKVTSPKHLGIYGGSWGGLLVSAAFIQKPQLFGAVVADVPMTDMLNYTLFRSGWAGEFGDPQDPQYTSILRSYSPYHTVKKEAKYPPVLFTSAVNDDRMHPAHARRMVAKMKDQGHQTYYFETQAGGHGGGLTNEEAARNLALKFTFFSKELGLAP